MEDVAATTESPPTLEEIFAQVRPWLSAYVQGSFPRMCAGHVEDATQEVFVCALEHPDRFIRAWQEGGQARVEGLCRLIAWRSARGRWSRSAYKREVGGDALLEICAERAAGQELVADVRMRLERVMDEALADISPACQARTRAAVMDRFLTGDTDTAVAHRHGVRREYVNRVKRKVQRSFLEPAA
ncbi:MAG: hypothetical protein D6798_03645 [Deltaproteobacteria bacterium]|nr:MAG: hypothetical protein D6798_03645 [Deltaproteobacteria bacterium]